MPRNLRVDVSCRATAGFLVYGMVGDMGPRGKLATVWVSNSTVGDRALGALPTSHKQHPLPAPISVRPGDTLKLRCAYHAPRPRAVASLAARVEHCQVTLLTLVGTEDARAPFLCSSPADFREVGLLDQYSHYKYLLLVGLAVLVLVAWCVVRARTSQRKRRESQEEFQGLLYEETDTKLK